MNRKEMEGVLKKRLFKGNGEGEKKGIDKGLSVSIDSSF